MGRLSPLSWHPPQSLHLLLSSFAWENTTLQMSKSPSSVGSSMIHLIPSEEKSPDQSNIKPTGEGWPWRAPRLPWATPGAEMSLERQMLPLGDPRRDQIDLKHWQDYLRVYHDQIWRDGGQEEADGQKSCECVQKVIETVLPSETCALVYILGLRSNIISQWLITVEMKKMNKSSLWIPANTTTSWPRNACREDKNSCKTIHHHQDCHLSLLLGTILGQSPLEQQMRSQF